MLKVLIILGVLIVKIADILVFVWISLTKHCIVYFLFSAVINGYHTDVPLCLDQNNVVIHQVVSLDICLTMRLMYIGYGLSRDQAL